ncbi:HAD hydrolase-like protein, partial [Streptomyces sp. SID4956]|nr:HAD hydrolase-like protein [Streptomyces sp. SID4956]
LGVDPADCVVVGDIGSDVEAACRAGAHAVLVPTPVTRPEETAAAPHVARDLPAAVRLILDGPPWETPGGTPALGLYADAEHARVASRRPPAGPAEAPPRTRRYL